MAYCTLPENALDDEDKFKQYCALAFTADEGE